MANKVPISTENIAFERLDLSRHYLTVDCDFTCFLVLNPSGKVPVEGTDICALHTGAWQIDTWTLLTKKDFPNQAGFVACVVWDKTLISETVHAPQCVESDIDISNSVSTLKGQPVNITGFTMPVGDSLPVSLLFDRVIVSHNHPLPVIRPSAELRFKRGESLIPHVAEFYAYDVHSIENGTVYAFHPNRFVLTKGDDVLAFFYGKFSHTSNGSCVKYFACNLPTFILEVSNEGNIVSRLSFSLAGTPLYETGGVTDFSNLVDGSTEVFIVES